MIPPSSLTATIILVIALVLSVIYFFATKVGKWIKSKQHTDYDPSDEMSAVDEDVFEDKKQSKQFKKSGWNDDCMTNEYYNPPKDESFRC